MLIEESIYLFRTTGTLSDGSYYVDYYSCFIKDEDDLKETVGSLKENYIRRLQLKNINITYKIDNLDEL